MKLIPVPKKIDCHEGNFTLTPETLIVLDAKCGLHELESACTPGSL